MMPSTDAIAPSLPPGVEVAYASDPARHAAVLAEERGGVAAADAATFEQVGRRLRLTSEALADLESLHEDVARAQRIREATETNVAGIVTRRLSSSVSLTVQAESLERAAQAVRDADGALASTELALRQHQETATRARTPSGGRTEMPWTGTPTAVFFMVLGVGMIIVGLGAIPLISLAVLPLVAALGAGGVMAWARRRPQPPALPPNDVERLAAERQKLLAEQEAARYQVEVARRAWETLAGREADPYNVDALIRTRENGFAEATATVTAAVDASPAIRTVGAFERRILARWRVAWANLGWEHPPTADEASELLPQLRQESEAVNESTGPLVLADPEDWIEPGALAIALAQLPSDRAVVVVRPESAEAASNSGA